MRVIIVFSYWWGSVDADAADPCDRFLVAVVEGGANGGVPLPGCAGAGFGASDRLELRQGCHAVADQNVATLRAEADRNPCDKALSDLIGELSTRGDTFPQRWAQHRVWRHRAGAKRLNHPPARQTTFNYQTMELAAGQSLYLIACGAAPGSRDADALNLLARWHATGNAENTTLNQT